MKFSTQLFLSLFLLCACCLPAHAGELLLAAMQKSPYQIVTSDSFNDKRIESSVKQAADLLAQAFAAQGVTLSVVTEADADKDKPSIYLGNTKYAASNGVTFNPDSGWTYTWKVVGKNVIIAGNDQPDPMPLEKRRPREARNGGIPIIGTLKGTCEFMYTYMGARFLQPGKFGLTFEISPVIFVPEDLNTTRRPYAQDIEVSRSNDIYQVANSMETNPLVLSNYGHFHHTAITEEMYGKTHPEYFIWRAGKRQTSSKHFCFSNPEVREIIYQKVLEDCDAGYKIIEMGQNDGWIPCGCKDCYNLYNIHPTHTPHEGIAYLTDAAWGEKLWIMHRDMAMRLMKDRPGHILMISAYAVAHNPPTTFSSFPPNVMIQIMHPSPEIFAAWHKLDVPGGYASYLYTWGSFHLAGYTPLRSMTEIKELTSTLVDNNVKLIQINGKPILYGIEGINIYAFGRMMNDPTAKPIEEHYNDYILAAYKEAAGPMQSFYRKLHQRLRFMPQAEEYARNLNRNPLLMYSTLYTPDFMDALEEQLSRAEQIVKDPGAKYRLSGTRMEFDFLKHIVNTITMYYAFQADPDAASYAKVIAAVEARNNWLKSIEGKQSGRVDNSQPSFSYDSIATLKTNGRRMNIEPFNWDTKARREMSLDQMNIKVPDVLATRATKAVKIDSPQWENVASNKLSTVVRLNKLPLEQTTTFKMMYDDNNLYVRVAGGMNADDMVFQSRGRDAEIWLQECINIQLSPTADKSQYFYLNYEPADNSFTDAEHGFITDPVHPQYGWNDNTWNGEWSYVNHMNKANNQWVSLVTIPFKTLRATPPESGKAWMFNIGRIHYKNQKAEPSKYKNRETSAWAGEVNASNIPGDAKMGALIFE